MTNTPDADALRAQIREKYRDVAVTPGSEFQVHTGQAGAERCGYDMTIVDGLPGRAVESFAGVANPFGLRELQPGERVVDAGSGGGLDSFVASHQVGPEGRVIGIDMTAEMVRKARECPTGRNATGCRTLRRRPLASPVARGSEVINC